MNRKEKEISQRTKNIIITICTVIIVLSVGAFGLITADLVSGDGFVYRESLGETVLTVGEESISLKEISYYILVAETNYNEAAQIYNKDNMEAFWNAKLNYKFFRNMVKQTVLDACTRDNTYYQKALKEGYMLSDEAVAEIEETAVEEINKLTEEQLEITDYQMSDMVKVLTKIAYAKEYVSNLMAQGYSENELDTGGVIYEEMKKAYSVEVNEKIWDKISLGAVTINNLYE